MIVTLDQFPIVDVGCSGRILLGCRRSDEETLLAVIGGELNYRRVTVLV
jgi:hypothetical protein